jgi:2-dehydropantoate 2-reductase
MRRVLVIGAGAIGSYLAARLAAAGAEVTLAARGSRLAALQRSGIVLSLDGISAVQQVALVGPGESAPAADLAILCTKMPDLEGSLDVLRPLAGEGLSGEGLSGKRLAVLTTQNGIDAPDMVRAALPGAAVLASRVHGFFEMDGAAVRHVGVPPSLGFGAWEPRHAALEPVLAALLAGAGVTAIPSADIRTELWRKLAFVGPLGATAAVCGVPAGKLRQDPAQWRMFEQAVAEVVAVGRAEGVDLGVDLGSDPVGDTLRFAEAIPAEATTSLQRDLAAGGRSEFDALIGTVLRRGLAAGLELPVHASFVSKLGPQH